MACNYVVLYDAQADIESIVAYLVSLTGGLSAAKAFMDEFNEKITL